MNIIIFLGFVVIFVTLLVVIISSPIDNTKVNLILDETSISQMTVTADYIGGLNSVLEKTKCTLILMNDKINIRIAFKDIDFLIHFNCISSIKVIGSEELKEYSHKKMYIHNKHKNNISNSFLVINYINSKTSTEETIIFENNYHEAFIDGYNETFRTWLCDNYTIDNIELSCDLNYLY